MHSPLLLRDLLAVEPVLIVDGAWGTTIAARDPSFAALPARAVLDAPHFISELAAEYIAAGAMAITTNTFRASGFVLEKAGVGERLEDLNTQAVRLARESGAACVLCSIAPLQQESGIRDEQWLYEQFKEQAFVLFRAGCPTAYLETFGSAEEAVIAMDACHAVGFDEVAVCLYPRVEAGSLGERLRMLEDAGADIVGINCTNSSGWMQELLKAPVDLPLMLRPNAGPPENYMPAEAFAAMMQPFADSPVRILGGCCGTTPAHIAALTETLPPAAPLW